MLWLLVPSLGCAPMGPPGGIESNDAPVLEGHVFVDPAVIDFGVFELPEKPGDDEFLTSTFSVYNANATGTILHGQDDVIGSAAFRVQASDVESLSGHEVVDYTVVFEPLVDDEYEGEISLNFGDATVELRGVALAPRLAVDEGVDITTPLGCEQTHVLRVENIGHDPTQPLVLNPNDFSKEGPQYGLSWASEDEIALAPGEVAELGLVFEPDVVGPHEIEARIQTNEPGDPIRTIAITARGIDAPETVDSFRFETELQASLLLVPDTRDAMGPTLDAMAASANALVTALAAKGDNDVNVAVVGGFGDVPCPATAERFYNTRFEGVAAAVAEGLTAAGAATGNLLDLAQGAVYEAAPGGCLAGFLRPRTALHVVVLSNGSEDSYSSPTTYAQSIANEVAALGGSGATLSVFVPDGEECTAEGCTRLLEATDYLNGAVWDLATDDWNGTLGAYGASLVPLHSWMPLILSQRAHEGENADDIVVRVGTEEVGPEWYWYNSGPQAVMLDTAAPIDAGAIVDVEYLASASCD